MIYTYFIYRVVVACHDNNIESKSLSYDSLKGTVVIVASTSCKLGDIHYVGQYSTMYNKVYPFQSEFI